MRFHCLACDYDGTLAQHGRIDEPTRAALDRFRGTGRRLVMVTGRELDELLAICDVSPFEWIVAENGALMYSPATRAIKLLAEPPPSTFAEALRHKGVAPLSCGRVIVATWEPHDQTVLETIREAGLELQVIFNKGAVMVLPGGVTKATGLTAALKEMGLSPHNVVGVGDAENDHAFLSICECGVAVANSVPAIHERADFSTALDHGAGVAELIEGIVADDLAGKSSRLARHHVPLGLLSDGSELSIPPYGVSLMIAGSSGAGKSTLAVGWLERLGAAGYQFCVIDPEGDYGTLEGSIALGTQEHPPDLDEVARLVADPSQNVVVNLVGLRLADRPASFATLIGRLLDQRARTGRPHWILVDEVHHVLPASRDSNASPLPDGVSELAFITVEPESVVGSVLSAVDYVIAAGEAPAKTLRAFAQATGKPPPPRSVEPAAGEVLVWRHAAPDPPFAMRVVPGQTERRRHRRKYAEGDLGDERSFYFRGPEKKLKLKAQNLILFNQLAAGVDEETWLHHLQAGDYSNWIRVGIKDESLAEQVAEIERQTGLSADESRCQIAAAIEGQYTLPAGREDAAEE